MQKYQLNLTESLYYQNLDNNAGVLCRLLDEAEEQENREAMLGYFFLWRAARPTTAEELDGQIEQFLAKLFGRQLDFEVSDALEKLLRLAIVESTADRSHTCRSTRPSNRLSTLAHAWPDGLRQLPIPAAKIEQRFAFANPRGFHLAHHDRVVAAGQQIDRAAFDRRQRVGNRRRTRCASW